jgi:hypothetical protein
MLLNSIVSTGTPGFNNASGTSYDKLPRTCGLAVKEELVDKDSFIDADVVVMAASPDLARREVMVYDESIEFIEASGRECKLFAYAIVFSVVTGKLTLSPILQPGLDAWDTQLDETNTLAQAGDDDEPSMDRPDLVTSISTVINQYRCKVDYDWVAEKYGKPIDITDANSEVALTAKRITIEHPGISVTSKTATAEQLLKGAGSPLLGRLLRFP